jgi:translocator protein
MMAASNIEPTKRWPLIGSVGFAVLPPFVAAALGGYFTAPAIDPWYRSLERTPITPPEWVFGPAWTGIYLLLAWSVWRVVKEPVGVPGRGRALRLFLVHIALNPVWSFVFFGLKAPWPAVAVIVVLFAAAARCFHHYLRVDLVSAALMLPYLGWLGFATALNIWTAAVN